MDFNFVEYWAPALASVVPGAVITEPGASPMAWTCALLEHVGVKRCELNTRQAHATGGVVKGFTLSGETITTRCVEIDMDQAYPTCALALDDDDKNDKTSASGATRRLVKAWIALRRDAELRGDAAAAKGAKLAVNTFIGCLRHVHAKTRETIVISLNDRIVRVKEAIEDLGLRVLAVLTDSVLLTNGPGATLTDDLVAALPEVCGNAADGAAFSVKADLQILRYVNTLCHIGLRSSDGGLFQRGVRKKKLSNAACIAFDEALLYLLRRERSKMHQKNKSQNNDDVVAKQEVAAIPAVAALLQKSERAHVVNEAYHLIMGVQTRLPPAADHGSRCVMCGGRHYDDATPDACIGALDAVICDHGLLIDSLIE